MQIYSWIFNRMHCICVIHLHFFIGELRIYSNCTIWFLHLLYTGYHRGRQVKRFFLYIYKQRKPEEQLSCGPAMDVRILCLLLLLNNGLCSSFELSKEFDVKPLIRDFRDKNTYIRARNEMIFAESNMRIGHDIVLNNQEQKVNQKLMKYKQLEINESRVQNGKPFPPSVSFLTGKPLVEKSQVFQMIKLMPKGM